MSASTGRDAELTGRLRAGLLPLAALVLALAAWPAEARAQAAERAGTRVELSPAYGTLEGDDFDGVGFGAGGELQLRRAWESGWSVGVGGRYTLHEAAGLDERLELLSAVLAPRYAVDADGLPFDPVFGMRAGYGRWSATASQASVTADFSAHGLEVGGTAGARFSVTGDVDVTIRGVASLVTFDDVSSDVEGSSLFQGGTLPQSGTLGAFFGVHGSLSFPFP